MRELIIRFVLVQIEYGNIAELREMMGVSIHTSYIHNEQIAAGGIYALLDRYELLPKNGVSTPELVCSLVNCLHLDSVCGLYCTNHLCQVTEAA